MSQVSTEVRDNPHCYICNSRVGVSTRNSVQIFNKQINTHSERPMHVIIGKVLGKELTETAVHSLLICKKCFKLFSEYDELETRLSEIKIEVVYNYRRTVVKYKGEADLKDDVEPIYVLKKLDEIKNEPTDDLKHVKHDKNQDNIKKTNSSDQRKAAQSSTGNKALNLIESQKQMEDIEMQLEKMYEETEDKTKTNEMTTQEEEIMEVETIEQIENYTDNVPQISIPEDDSRSFEELIEEDDEPVDAGAIDNSDDSDYQPPVVLEVIQNGDDKQNGDDNTAALLEAAALAEQHEDGTLMFNVKLEPGVTYEDLKQAVRKKSGHKKLLRAKMEEYTDPIVSRDGAIYTCLVCEAESTAENGGEATGERVLGDAKAMMEHVKQAHDLRVYICDLCGDDFRKRNELNAHLDEHVAAEDGDFQCETCNRIFSNLRLFRIHKRMHYPQNKLWTCESCGKRYSSRNLLEEHINTHTGYRPYVCNVCNKDFASKYTYRAHMKTHEVRPRPFQCSQCDKSFLSQQNLTQHERTHTGIKDHVCNLCGKAFGSTHNLEVHSIVHTGYKPFICRTCGKAFARKAEIRDHERTHTGERPYQCEFCGATFSQRSNLQSHKRATHYDDKRYKCHECGKGFKRRRLLDYHMKAVHTGERPFKCTVCNATFVYPEHFKKHRRIHTGEKPFLCEVCGKAFNSRDNRNAHRFVHSDKKPYECLVCGMGFMRKPLLYAHMEAQGHLNDTIVVNQPRLTTDDDQVVTFNIDGELEVVDGQGIEEDTKMYITDHMIVHESEDGTLIIPEQEGTEGKVGRLIIDGQEVRYAENADDEVEITTGEITTAEHILQAAASGAQGRDEYEEVITDGLVNEHNSGQIQIVQIRINKDGEEQDAWVNLVTE